uniref:PNPLA domain-containing protein n=1 Tax=Mucochytrium quahogii TaxID=96639 RepID=A0A7S2WHC3_9STRA|mmetsp:Transcript_37442/g.60939  ORF Transcript_37442/g.60939 Transcript_37442/m.60939 type:complete len:850 (+) Transcript_37442:199-2748(+)|eukprot:CAMPEP_0203764168 /NCGR_PEP_ID=MMETSP0098-20131031/17484_1 /ASSEMBLY_ACC=CAM_ASM_000208 /TAXON_ID=96639 /ORGANISM=" , Strain NY0313808BC1" /LENGTH=849 /DNA_ID=CAMNT_0050659905 /DNA_START=167 /DNA_END=2716 /DNA_ORIENTATION=+
MVSLPLTVQTVVWPAYKLAILYVKLVLFFCGLKLEDFLIPQATPGRNAALDFIVRLVRFTARWLVKVFHPEVFIRGIVTTIIFQGVYGVGVYTWKRVYYWLASFTKKGAKIKGCREKMLEATTYQEFRAAQREWHRLSATHLEPLSAEQQQLCNKLDRSFIRYRDYVRENNLRKLQFELRSDLLRKHFGHEQFHPCVHDAIQRYVGIVCCSFALLATGKVPEELRELAYGKESAEEVQDSLDRYKYNRESHSSSMVNMLQIDVLQNKEETNKYELRKDLSEKLSVAKTTLDFFAETRHQFGRSALLLSGGARMGLYHVGVIKTLLEQNMLPRVISGSSAGSIIAATLACKTNEELMDQLFDPSQMNLKFFGRTDSIDNGLQCLLRGEDPPEYVKKSLFTAFTGEEGGSGLLGTLLMLLPPPFPSYIMLLKKLLPRWAKSKVLLDIDILKQAIRNVIGDMTFQEAYDRTGRIVNITVTPHGGDRDLPNLLNYLSAPYVTIWSAACASSCIPGVFAPVTLMAKTIDGDLEPYSPAGLRWIDGSLESDLPMQRLSELFNINHFIVAQVNPHAKLLSHHEEAELEEMSPWDRHGWKTLGSVVSFFRDQSRSYIKHITKLGIGNHILMPFGKGIVPVLVQKYSGDITLYPNIKASDIRRLLQNPTNEQYLECMLGGERMTWPKLQSIRRQCMVEFMLDDCVSAMRELIRKLETRLAENKSYSTRSDNLTPPSPLFKSSGVSRVSSYSVLKNHAGGQCHENYQNEDTPQVPSPSRSFKADPSSRFDMGAIHEDRTAHLPPPIPPTAEGFENDMGNLDSPEPSPHLNLGSKLIGRIQSVQQLSQSVDGDNTDEFDE